MASFVKVLPDDKTWTEEIIESKDGLQGEHAGEARSRRRRAPAASSPGWRQTAPAPRGAIATRFH